MHLKQLKLAGFKSFVDPTSVLLPSQRVVIVGPNGCGKSNIIDAVRWVMGESSAKNLRGESMIDVIFNGSTNRKGVGQASVELVFDNSLGRMGGQYASYAEISIKRVVTREGDSSYYLNGSRCRKRDITDIFLGTGAGAKGYSIISQGTISQLIEAKPEELRLFLEEAAGVSRSRDRRKETLNRLEHTRDNLVRVEDIRQELGNQLQKLEKQAKAAERYQLLKQEENRYKAEILVKKWQVLDDQKQKKSEAITQHQVFLEEIHAVMTQCHYQKVQLVQTWETAQADTQKTQETFFHLGTEIARLEENLLQQQREHQRLIKEEESLQNALLETTWKLETEEQNLSTSQENLIQLQERLEHEKQDYLVLQTNWQSQQLKKEELDSHWQTLQDELTAIQRKEQSQRLDLQNREEKYEYLEKREQVLLQENKENFSEQWETQLAQLAIEHQALSLKKEQAEELLQEAQQDELQLKQAIQATEESIRKIQDRQHQRAIEHAALEAIQQAALTGQKDKQAQSDKQRQFLADSLDVATPWQSACEMVLGDFLQAVILETEELTDFLGDTKYHGAVLRPKPSLLPGKLARLIDFIQGNLPHTPIPLESIYTTETLTQALAEITNINAQESIVTLDGYWLGKGWIRVPAQKEDGQEGLLTRQQRIKTLQEELVGITQELELGKTKREELTAKLNKKQRVTEESQQQVFSLAETVKATALELTHKRLQFEQQRKHQEGQMLELAQHQQQKQQLAPDIESLKTLIVAVEAQRENLELKVQGMQELRQSLAPNLTQLREELQQSQDKFYQTQRDLDREIQKVQHCKDSISRYKEKIAEISEKHETVALSLHQLTEPDNALKSLVQEKVGVYRELERQLHQEREQVNVLKQQLDSLEETIRKKEQESKSAQEALNQLRLDEQGLAIKAQTQVDNLNEMGLTLSQVSLDLQEGKSLEALEHELLATYERIKRLGAINLAAIEEYNLEGERKRHLDSQYQDLILALESLEKAIAEIDEEIRTRLLQTFNEVNERFQLLFPRLFGGGRAHLQLTCDNLLEAGVFVMAQPPGKKNSSIHLLSGGEKALTAVALVFAIFQLNPSPFCMLDEVDAPLDDVNVGRFCAMVGEMSAVVQFLIITHNKITMELADHLIGVTMREPGVSRLVAVDIQQALTLE